MGTRHELGGRTGRKAASPHGFSMVEVLVGMFIMAVALLGLAQLFSMSIMQNKRANDLSNASFLAQARIDELRGLTLAEIAVLSGTGDERLDLNSDGTDDFRRLTRVALDGTEWEIQIMVFPPSQLGTPEGDLATDPGGHKVLARISTRISR